MDLGVAGIINGNVLMFVKPEGVPINRSLELLWNDLQG